VNPFAAWISAKPVFIIWRGSDKSPIDPLHSETASDFARSDAQNPATWLSWDIATAYAQSLGAGYGVGIVIHEGSGLLCVDIDGCITDGQLSTLAKTVIKDAYTASPDAYVEISMSGKGVHIIGPYEGEPPPHSTKNQELHMELYTSRRYIALTGNMIRADDARLN
jgi:primase-polymerase (primpol)-like protein